MVEVFDHPDNKAHQMTYKGPIKPRQLVNDQSSDVVKNTIEANTHLKIKRQILMTS